MSEEQSARTCTAFAGNRRWAAGSYAHVARALKERADELGEATVLVFDGGSGRQMDFDLRGTADEVEARYADAASASSAAAVEGPGERRGPGRPKLGVVSKEVTLLPRHWAWLAAQRGGASATLRRLVDRARQAGQGAAAVRGAQDAAYRFSSAMAGDLPGFEEAMRALYAKDRPGFEGGTDGWPQDVRDHARELAEPAFAAPAPGSEA